MAVYVAQTPVHVPLHIVNLYASQDPGNPLKEIIPDLLPAHIQNKLVSPPVRLSSRYLQRPVRMLTVQIAVLGNHLRLEPETELHSHIMNLPGELPEASFQLFLVHIPVAQTAVVIISLAKPSVVKNQHLNSKLRRLPGNVQDFLPVKIKISGLPVVDQNRTFLILILSSAHMLPQDPVVLLGKFGKAAVGIAKDHLRRPEGLALLQDPGELSRIDSHNHPCLPSLILPGRGREITAVDKAEAITVPEILRSIRTADNHGRIVLMAGGSPHAADLQPCAPDPVSLRFSLHSMPAAEGHKIIVSELEIQAE